MVELAPRDVPDDALSDADFTALAKAFVARGGEPAGDITLSGAFADPPATGGHPGRLGNPERGQPTVPPTAVSTEIDVTGGGV
jgi:hypothetical protein